MEDPININLIKLVDGVVQVFCILTYFYLLVLAITERRARKYPTKIVNLTFPFSFLNFILCILKLCSHVFYLSMKCPCVCLNVLCAEVFQILKPLQISFDQCLYNISLLSLLLFIYVCIGKVVSYRLNIVMSCLKKIQPNNHCLFFRAFIFNLITVMLELNLYWWFSSTCLMYFQFPFSSFFPSLSSLWAYQSHSLVSSKLP